MQACRRDPVAFIEYVFRIRLDPEQVSWIRYWEANEASVLHAGVGIGKSTIARMFVLWLVGNDTSTQVIWLGATQRQPKDQLATIARLIESVEVSSRLHHVFPTLRPGAIWQSTKAEVERELTGLEASPTISCFGAFSPSVLGSRATVLVIDDLCNFTNTLTEDGRTKMIEWLSTVLTRLTKDELKIIAIGNYWHDNDALRDLAKNKGFTYRKTPAFHRDPRDPEDPEKWVSTCPSALSAKAAVKLAAKLGPRKARQMLECEKPDLNLGRFKEIWFEAALREGMGKPWRPSRAFYPVFTGVDLGHSGSPGADRTAMITAMVLPDGRRQFLDVRSGNWDSPEILRNMRDLHLRYSSTIGVENNGGQKLFANVAARVAIIPCIEHNTNQINKRDLVNGVEGLAIALSQGHWIFPCPKAPTMTPAGLVETDDPEAAPSSMRGQPHEELQALIDDALVYDPSRPRRHTGDRLMAWWILSEVIRKSALHEYDAHQVVPVDDVPSFDLFSR